MMRSKRKTIFVGMSGGVDSSVSAYLLKNQGHDVTGVFLRSYNVDGCAEGDAEDARRVAEKIDIPFYVWDVEDEYKQRVVKYMVEGYRRGETPNPDVMCNREIKFGIFLDRARALGADYVATGHYVRRRGNALYIAKDKNKDQSYFLWALTPEQIKYALFPIGDYLKPEVRAIAKRAGLSTAEKKDSQGICFLGQVTLQDFLTAYMPEKKGEVVTTDGKKIGEHRGAYFYTIGQRHGLDLKSKNKELGRHGNVGTAAHYVSSKDVSTNTITVAEGSDDKALFKKEVVLRDVNLMSLRSGSILARVRYHQPLAEAQLIKVEDNWKLTFTKPQKFVAEGQSAVFYSKDGDPSTSSGLRMLGGGVIA